MLAARSGARRVIAIEQLPGLAALARQIVARNGLADRIEVLSARSTDVDLAIECDVILAELVGLPRVEVTGGFRRRLPSVGS